ncbi:hypothetical protein F4212_07535, partial [Candidatus Poribacteria bacterium]|nr:hypothetical protein [Candidatus Poribacteria bacterium]
MPSRAKAAGSPARRLMNEKTREQAKIGLSHLKEAVLNVLYQAQLNNDECLKQFTVYKSLELPEPPKKRTSANSKFRYDWRNTMTRIFLSLLLEEGMVERCQLNKDIKGWRLTDTEFQKRHKKLDEEETREQAKIGLSHLKEAILEVLYQVRLNNDECLKHVTIYKSLELPGPSVKKASANSKFWYDWRSPMTSIFLSLLLEEGMVERNQLNKDLKGWRLTDT